MANVPSSATRPTGRVDCNSDAMAGFAAAHGLARLTFTQRTTDVRLPTKAEAFDQSNLLPPRIKTVGRLLVDYRRQMGLTQKQVAGKAGIPRKWLGRWERGRAMPDQARWSTLAAILNLPGELKSLSL
jgi:DNA-binding transcriptional regulator YiaG